MPGKNGGIDRKIRGKMAMHQILPIHFSGPMKKMRISPKTLNAGMVKPKSSNMYLPT